MKIHITNLYGQAGNSVAMLAQQMVTAYARELGFHEIGIYAYPIDTDSPTELSKRIDGMLAALSMGDIVIVQSPSWNTTAFDNYFIDKLRGYAGIKVVIFVHDVVPLMFASNDYLMPKVIDMYNKADVLILPSEQMARVLKERGLTTDKLIYQRMWDHPNPLPYHEPPFVRQVQFSGEAERFAFINDWHFEIPMLNYAYQAPAKEGINVIAKGWHKDLELLGELAKQGGFGLVWSQAENSQYYEWNISYKLGTYLAAGLPVIVPSTLSNADIVKQNNLGFVVSSLEEANESIQKMSQETYQGMVASVKHYQQLVTNGYFSKKVLIDSIHAALTNCEDTSN